MVRICSLIVLLVAAMPALADVTGRIRVIDGDTFEIGQTRVRLHGLDTPESDQMCGGGDAPMWACGDWVTRQVRARYDGRQARCIALDRDRYGRVVARCTVDGHDVGQALVEDGLAFAYRRYSMDYDLAEKGAAVQGKGLHGAGVQSPATYRANSRKARAAVNLAEAPEGCVIKGNISSSGRIFHVPGQEHYDGTRISPAKGERWFCDEAEARAAGWRKARR